MGWLKPRFIFILTLFEIGWLLCVFFQNALVSCITLIFASIIFLIDTPTWRKFAVLLFISALGCFNDFGLKYFDIFIFKSTVLFIPFWLISLWVLFVSTFNNVLSFLNNKPIAWIAVIGGSAGALSYFLGSQLGEIQYDANMPQIVLHFLNWVILFPVLFKLNFVLNHFRVNLL